MAIVGGGPIGLECLLRARRAGWDAELFERGRVGQNVRAWGHVRMFSPWSMNVSDAGRRALGVAVDESLPTGLELAERYLDLIARLPDLAPRVREGAEVVAIARGELRKGDAIGSSARARCPFRLLVIEGGRERSAEADVVVDASGSFTNANWMGEGGIPAVGERDLRTAIDYRLPDVDGRDRGRFAGRHTVVVGHGHSAATVVGWLAALAVEAPETRVTWLTRSAAARPVVEIAADPLAERARVVGLANDAAEREESWLERNRGARVRGIRRANGRFAITVTTRGGMEPDRSVDDRGREIRADRVLAMVGYHPDLAPLRELQVQTCWATEGTYPLAAALLSRSGAASDCLSAGAELDAKTLLHPEPGFFVLGAKSYGRNPHFLLRSGLKQVDDLFGLLEARS